MDLFERVSEDIKNVMKVKDKVVFEIFRNVKKFFLEVKIVLGVNDIFIDVDVLKIV